MPSPGDQPAPENEGLRPLNLGLTWALTALAAIAVAARFAVRKRVSRAWGLDDWIMLLAMVLQLFYQSIFTLMCAWGLGIPFQDQSPLQQMMLEKWGYISAFPSISISFTARISITILLIRIFGSRKWFRWYFISFTATLTLVGVLSIIFLAASSDPWEGLWDHDLPARRLDPWVYQGTAIAAQFLNAISDFTYVLFPVLIIWTLNMPLRRKVALLFLMAASLITMGVVLLKIVLIFIRLGDFAAQSQDLQRYFQSLVHLVACCEQCLVIIMGCVPTLKLVATLKLPTVNDISYFLSSLLSRGSGRSRGTSAYNTGSDWELAPRVSTPADEATMTAPKIIQRKEFTIAYS
ncbi:hypothetical protein GGS23DRAFT_481206 [Durotheca rogersii]|uniref:uncharacterized protein n=1 Tax=Durotheca rogersii TaxID=419775 RepID=UPI00221F47DE|nr:uncharacterized protein GGS23DRAFT_481206 [Durotheca rogersii]KAI5864076.1 hypothetical protein GGS23DRAFT_481206 [Durotheca rogersii]